MATPVTTLVSFADLPTCATLCGQLYDANGACVPPAAATGDLGTYASCFCNNAAVSAFVTGTTGVCENTACTAAADAGGIASIHTWMSTWCAANAGKAATATSGTAGKTATSSGSTSTSTSTKSASSGGGTWMSSHWQWVIFIVVVVVGIAGIWIGACIWRRRYLRKKDRQYALGKSLAARTSTGGTGGTNPSQNSVHMPHAGMFDPASISSANVYETEKLRSSGRRK